MAASQPHRALIFHSISNTRLDGHEQLNKEAGDASMTKTQENNMMFTIRISGEEWEGTRPLMFLFPILPPFCAPTFPSSEGAFTSCDHGVTTTPPLGKLPFGLADMCVLPDKGHVKPCGPDGIPHIAAPWGQWGKGCSHSSLPALRVNWDQVARVHTHTHLCSNTPECPTFKIKQWLSKTV